MSSLSCVISICLVLHAAHSYILLTANLEDVQTLAKQLATSPVMEQLGKIWRRASHQFNERREQENKIQRRDDRGDVPSTENRTAEIPASAEPEVSEDHPSRRSNSDHEDLVSLGKNASLYLKSIRKIFENV